MEIPNASGANPNPMSKKPTPTPLTPAKKLILTGWTLFVVMLTLILFRGVDGRIKLAALVLMPVIFGLLLGMRMLDRFDEIAKSFGFNPAPPAPPGPGAAKTFDDFLAFLKSHQTKGQFTTTELRKFCEKRNLQEVTLIAIGQKKGWFHEMGGAYVISSEGDAMLQKFS